MNNDYRNFFSIFSLRDIWGFLIPGTIWIAIFTLIDLYFLNDRYTNNFLNYFTTNHITPILYVFLLIFVYTAGYIGMILFIKVNKIFNKKETSSRVCLKIDGATCAKIKLLNPSCYEDTLAVCKAYVIENSKELGKILLRIESEINFLAGMVLPLFFSGLLIIVYGIIYGIKHNFTCPIIILISGGILFFIIACLVYKRFTWLRKGEEDYIIRYFEILINK